MKIISFDSNDKNKLNIFIDLEYELYKNDTNYIPPFKNKLLTKLDMKLNPFYNYGKGIYLLAMDNDMVVGRIGAFRNPKMDKDGFKIGTVGFFECVNNYDVCKKLLDKSLDWLIRENVNIMS